MATYQNIPLAGNIPGQNVFRITFGTYDCSDIPQVTAWDDYLMNTVIKESLAGTTGNGSVSSICVADTEPGATVDGWATALTQTSGAAHTNRCKGNTAYTILGTAVPIAADVRRFQLAIGLTYDFGAGTTGHDPVIGIKAFYTGSPPVLSFHYNSTNSESTPTWVQLNLQTKGVGTEPSLPNTIYGTGLDTTTSSLDPVTKPDTGEIFAPEYWSKTVA